MNPATRRGITTTFNIFGPLFLTAVPWLVWTLVSRLLSSGDLPGGIWVWLLLPPALLLEWYTTRIFGRIPARRLWRIARVATLFLRLSVLCLGFFLLVGRTAALRDTPDIYAPLIGLWPVVARMPYIESPVLGAAGVLLMIALYLALTVRQQILRMTTVLIVPALFTLALFHFYYAFPTNPVHFHRLTPDAGVERVYPFPGKDDPESDVPFMARDLFVTPDEQIVVTSYGSTFHVFPQRTETNLAWIDLPHRNIRTQEGRVIRRFRSTCSDRIYAAPWNGSDILEIDPATFKTTTIQFPKRVDGYQIEEIHGVLHDCERHRVIVANSRNPVVFIWDTKSRTMEKTLHLADLEGVRVGDHVIPLALNPVTHGIYLGTTGRKPILELSADSLDTVRAGETPDMAFDLNISPDGKFIYVSSFVSGYVWRFDAETMKIVKTYRVPIHCRRVATSRDGKVLHVLSYLTGELLSFDAETARLLDRTWIGPKPEGLFVSENYLWISAATGIFRLPSKAIPGPDATR